MSGRTRHPAWLLLPVLLCTAAPFVAQTPDAGAPGGAAASDGFLAELQKTGALPGEPQTVSAGGVTRAERSLYTIENASPFLETDQRRVVIVGGLDGDERGAHAALSAVAWFKTKAPQSLRRAWSVSALPFADPDRRAPSRSFQFPPQKGFFDDPEQPESRYVWRWVNYQAPDLVLEIRGGDSISWQGAGFPALKSTADRPADSLSSALSASSDLGTAPALRVTGRAIDGPQILRQALEAAAGIRRSPLHATLAARAARKPLDIARVLALRYPQNAIVSYIPSVAWANTLRLAAATNDPSLRMKVLQQTQPWLSGRQPLFGERIVLTAVAGTMIYAELAEAGDESARALAVRGAEAAAAVGPDGVAQYGQGWTDDMFMTATVLARTGKMPGRQRDLDRAASLLISYARRLQREDGIFTHFTDGQRPPWGRGNGFAALGLMEALTSLPAAHPDRASVLSIFQRQMTGLKLMQAPDGMWRQVIDQPGSYREESATAMVLTAMARGVQAWLARQDVPPVHRSRVACARRSRHRRWEHRRHLHQHRSGTHAALLFRPGGDRRTRRSWRSHGPACFNGDGRAQIASMLHFHQC